MTPPRMPIRRMLVVWLQSFALLTALAGCAGAPPREPLLVLAASSLTDVMPALEGSFEADHPRVDVKFSTAGTQALRLQIEQGARADVLLAADPSHVEALVDAGLVQAHGHFATNRLALIVPDDSPITRFEELVKAERIVLGAPSVPLGRYTDRALQAALATRDEALASHVHSHIVSREASARQVRTKLSLGEADAAIVYITDTRDAPGIRTIPLPPEMASLAHYPAATLRTSRNPALAERFVEHVKGLTGRDLLVDHGFGPP